jgi:NADH:ubiquinone oxidoreductase subunit 6 (subunit J)
MMLLLLGLPLGAVTYLVGRSIVASAAAALACAFIAWATLPVLRIDFAGPWLIAVYGLVIGAAITFIAGASGSSNSSERDRSFVLAIMATAILAVLAVASFVTSSPIFRARDYAALIGDVREVPFQDAIKRVSTDGKQADDGTVIDQSDIPLVPEAVATKRAQDLLGTDPSLGGTFTLGEPHRTRRAGRVVYAFPLEYTGLLKYLSGGPIPGVIWVDANDDRQGQFVREVDGKPIAIRCAESAWFGDNLERAVWNQGHRTVGLTDYSLELDDRGAPMYVVTEYAHRVGFSGADVTGVTVFDPQTCTSVDYGLDKLPAWVNRVVPSAMVAQQVTDWGAYREGWNNQAFGAHKGVLVPAVPTDGDGEGVVLLPMSHGGSTAWYVGVTTPGNPNGTIGFIVVDSRTKRAVFFRQNGATEQAAARNMQAKEPRQGYGSSWPILVNVEGTATYMSVMLDPSGNYGGIGMTPVGDRDLVVLAPDIRTAVREMRQGLARVAGGTGLVPGGKPDAIAARIARIGSFTANGRTAYFFLLQGRPGAVFNADPSAFGATLPLAREGDLVHVTANDDGSGGYTVSSMTDEALAAAPTEPAARHD